MKIYKLGVCKVPGNMISAPQTQNKVSLENLYVTRGIAVRYGTIYYISTREQSHCIWDFNSLWLFFSNLCVPPLPLFALYLFILISSITCNFFCFLTNTLLNVAFL